jgi:triosephosphate isomerase
MTPILCVGETLEDRRGNRTEEVIQRQMRTALQQADASKPLWVAYEPVWAIGTGEVASPAQVEEAHAFARKLLRDWNSTAGAQAPILYGGSVKSDNARTLAGIKDVNGFLIGGASLDVAEFLKILRFSNETRKA